jgi:hypothetical protein
MPAMACRQGPPSYVPVPVRNQGPRFELVDDRTIAFMPFFAIKDAERFRETCNRCIEKVKDETLCLGFGFSLSAGPQGEMAFSRESYVNAEGLIEHLQNIEILFLEGLCRYGQLVSLQVHGPKDELDKLRQHPIIQELGPQFYELMPGSFEVIELPAQQILEVPTMERTGSSNQLWKQLQANAVPCNVIPAGVRTAPASEDMQDRFELAHGRATSTTYTIPPSVH